MIVYDIQNLVKIYPGQDKPANDGITLQIQQGEIFGLLGDNGAGKSTLVRQMANLLKSSAGSIHLYGQPIGSDPLHAPRHIGYMPQDGLALNNLTVEEAIYFTAHLRGLGREAARRECARLLDLWQLGEIRRRPNIRLSGGQKRLLQLAVAMAGSPAVLLLDEPTNDLDPQRRKRVWETLRQLNQENGTTILFITHDAIEAEKVIQRVGIMFGGKLVALGRPSELKARIDHKLRLELFFSPEAPPCLPPGLVPHPVDAGRWLVYLDWEDAHTALDRLDLSRLDDFRLYSATLEDLYLYYANRT
jgi:ABC-type multidrug transport system ATPase subunit